MDELITIIEERKSSIHQMKNSSQPKHKSVLVEEERKRNQRENWIMRVLKTLKVPSLDQKKYTRPQKRIIFETSVKIMNYYQPIQKKIDNFQGINFIQSFINLFVQFYNKFQQMDLAHIKTIIRPNNSYIVVDLIKTLVELGRKEFKNAIQDQFRQVTVAKIQRKSLSKREFSPVKQESNMNLTNNNFRLAEDSTPKRQSLEQINKKITTSLFQKYSKAIDNYNLQTVYERFNELYYDLLYLNNKNSVRIQKYLDHCFGTKRHIVYDASGLYTQEEIKKMVNQQQQKTRSRAAMLKQLKGNCSPQHLKQFFKIKVEMHSELTSIPNFIKQPQIRFWFPIVMLKNGDKLHPYMQMLQINGIYFTIYQFQQKINKKLKVHMKELLKQHFQHREMKHCDDPDMISFNRKDYLDFNNCKIVQLLVGKEKEPNSYKRQKDKQKQKQKEKQKEKEKQSFLPPISSSTQLSQTQNPKVITKARSETKLPNTSLIIAPKGTQNLSLMIQKRMNHTSIHSKDQKPSKKKMDNIIDTIIRSRQYTIN